MEKDPVSKWWAGLDQLQQIIILGLAILACGFFLTICITCVQCCVGKVVEDNDDDDDDVRFSEMKEYENSRIG